MKSIPLTTIAAVVLVEYGESKKSTHSPEPATAKALDISIHDAAKAENIEAALIILEPI